MAKDPKDEVYKAILAAYRPLGVDYVEGVDTTDQPVPEARCPKCQATEVRYRGSTVLEGGLEFCHLVHTEVEHHLQCAAPCGHRWDVFKMI